MVQPSPVSASFQLILDTAEQLIREKGCRQTTLQDIIDRSGLSKGAIYHYVSGKDELFGLILKSRMEEVNVKFFETVADQQTASVNRPLQTIAEGMARSAEHLDVSNKIFIYLLGQMDNPKVAGLVRGIYEHTLATSSRWIGVGQENGVIPPSVDAQKMAMMFVTFLYGMRVQSVIDPERDALALGDIYQMMFRSLQ
ncbi:TetR/AcrR family transcriptional regulator [Paenibacillus validus]|nr:MULTISPECIES: TetR/AcrR family transcriptional regulator [Paenibacillus]MED4603327.1 TetR/AcrR family transcriptional regulator [Paenibacillus validus]MED4609217.1 TetR/AcrR family transcriptional regulator [Paenibacillus validus]